MKSVEISYHYEVPDPLIPVPPADAAAARRRLEEGNRSFAALLDELGSGETGTARRVVHVDPRDLNLSPAAAGVTRQHPFAAVLGCSDARVPIELVFGEGPNDLFVVRVAGNGTGGDVMGSLRFAIEQLRESLRLVVVLGHSGCGAAGAAVDVYLSPSAYLPLASSDALRGLIDRLLIVVQASALALAGVYGDGVRARPGYRAALIEMVVAVNAALAARTVACELGHPGLAVVYGVYLLEQRHVWSPASADGTGLADPPQDSAAFDALRERLAGSARIAALL